jgi:hypothetical protein
VIADIIRINRVLIEDTLERLKRMEYGNSDTPQKKP